MTIMYSSQGDLLVTRGADNSLRLWDIASGQCLSEGRMFNDSIACVTCFELSGRLYVAAGSIEGPTGVWTVEREEDSCQLKMLWITTNGELAVRGSNFQGTNGLNKLNTRLLMQRGAIGEPNDILQEATKKLASMASVISKMKTPAVAAASRNAPALDPSTFMEQLKHQLKQRAEETQDPLVQSVITALAHSYT
jgi:hypothetical protein